MVEMNRGSLVRGASRWMLALALAWSSIAARASAQSVAAGQSANAPPAVAHVVLLAESGGASFGVTLESEGDERSCTLPCELDVAPGRARLRGRGFGLDLSLAPGRTVVTAREGAPVGDFVLASVLAALGGGAAGLGLWMYLPADEVYSRTRVQSDEWAAGLALTVVGGVIGGLGLVGLLMSLAQIRGHASVGEATRLARLEGVPDVALSASPEGATVRLGWTF